VIGLIVYFDDEFYLLYCLMIYAVLSTPDITSNVLLFLLFLHFYYLDADE
jgi:hypothetical protein